MEKNINMVGDGQSMKIPFWLSFLSLLLLLRFLLLLPLLPLLLLLKR